MHALVCLLEIVVVVVVEVVVVVVVVVVVIVVVVVVVVVVARARDQLKYITPSLASRDTGTRKKAGIVAIHSVPCTGFFIRVG